MLRFAQVPVEVHRDGACEHASAQRHFEAALGQRDESVGRERRERGQFGGEMLRKRNAVVRTERREVELDVAHQLLDHVASDQVVVVQFDAALPGCYGARFADLYQGADRKALEFYKMMMAAEMDGKIASIQLLDLTPKDKARADSTQSPDGRAMKLVLPTTKKLVVKSETKDASGTSSSTSELFVAESDGQLYILVPAAAK